MNTILDRAEKIQKQAWNIINEIEIVQIWENVGATINLIGSLKTGLMINHRDIDFHIYTDPFDLSKSFSAIEQLAKNTNIKKIEYNNLLEDEDQCIEWHATYKDKYKNEWTLDLIHIHPDSKYAGYFEKVSERILSVLTEENKIKILTIKEETAHGPKIPAIKIYQAVLNENVSTTHDFLRWYNTQNTTDITHWFP